MENILIVDDDKKLQSLLCTILESGGYKAVAADNGDEALKKILDENFDLILLDNQLPGTSGLEVLEQAKHLNDNLNIIMLTGNRDINNAIKAMKLGASDYIVKPFDKDELLIRIDKAIKSYNADREVEFLRKTIEENAMKIQFVGESPQIIKVLNQVKIVAPLNMTVIIQGESGTGKDLIAQMIHNMSPRKNNPFVAIDCGSIPESLAESELFGYEKGAFTGTVGRKEGRFETANGGSLFLDEINNLSPAVQMKLLRIIQGKKVQRLGGKNSQKIDVRIIIATNINLAEAVSKGSFRNDLFHRLNEFYIVLPPLRDRKDDIPIMSKHFLAEANSEFNKNVKGFTPEAMEYLYNYNWSGNVRELRNMVRRAVVLAQKEDIERENIIANFVAMPASDTEESLPDMPPGISFDDAMDNVEKKIIQKALDHAEGNQSKAAKILKMNRKTLFRKIRKLEL
ncbi:MAG: sigma-54-dependent Fis family transcriptional regulator [Planctomycetes bacterium]|nr:sigma-54-dependent Fis family transcriptional regulator [Planctomycetota bacterium]